jgi:hypothetical protein
LARVSDRVAPEHLRGGGEGNGIPEHEREFAAAIAANLDGRSEGITPVHFQILADADLLGVQAAAPRRASLR